jgi:hypothetical protein
MIEYKEEKPLVDRIEELLNYTNDLDCFYKHNEEVLDIYEGNLLPYVEKLMEETLDARYFKLIKHRIVPVNFIQKIVDKLAKSYADSPMRKCEDQDFVDFYEEAMSVDFNMMSAEEYSHLNKGYALKPKLTNRGKLKMDVLAFDKFAVKADDTSDKMLPTVFIEFLGKVEREVVVRRKTVLKEIDCYIAYTDTEIIGYDAAGNQILEVAKELGYKNPIGQIPFIYGNRSRSNITPKQDTDFLKLSKILPLMLSDINGALMFQCFTLIYGIDVEFNDASMNPNAIWDLRSDPKSDKNPQIGTLQPSVDSDKALTFFKNILAMWLDTKGIDAGSIMQLDSQEVASGLAKAMDEMDTTEARKKSITYLEKEEKELFILLAKMNNYWRGVPEAKDLKLKLVDVEKISESMTIEFKEPVAQLDYTSEIKNSIDMLSNGLSYREKEIKRLHPYASEEEIDMIFFEYGEPRHEVGSKDVEDAIDPDKEEELPKEDEEDNQTPEAPADENEANEEAEPMEEEVNEETE